MWAAQLERPSHACAAARRTRTAPRVWGSSGFACRPSDEPAGVGIARRIGRSSVSSGRRTRDPRPVPIRKPPANAGSGPIASSSLARLGGCVEQRRDVDSQVAGSAAARAAPRPSSGRRATITTDPRGVGDRDRVPSGRSSRTASTAWSTRRVRPSRASARPGPGDPPLVATCRPRHRHEEAPGDPRQRSPPHQRSSCVWGSAPKDPRQRLPLDSPSTQQLDSHVSSTCDMHASRSNGRKALSLSEPMSRARPAETGAPGPPSPPSDTPRTRARSRSTRPE